MPCKNQSSPWKRNTSVWPLDNPVRLCMKSLVLGIFPIRRCHLPHTLLFFFLRLTLLSSPPPPHLPLSLSPCRQYTVRRIILQSCSLGEPTFKGAIPLSRSLSLPAICLIINRLFLSLHSTFVNFFKANFNVCVSALRVNWLLITAGKFRINYFYNCAYGARSCQPCVCSSFGFFFPFFFFSSCFFLHLCLFLLFNYSPVGVAFFTVLSGAVTASCIWSSLSHVMGSTSSARTVPPSTQFQRSSTTTPPTSYPSGVQNTSLCSSLWWSRLSENMHSCTLAHKHKHRPGLLLA